MECAPTRRDMGCSYLADDIILLPERERETEMVSGLVPMQTDCAVYTVSMVHYSGRNLGSGSN